MTALGHTPRDRAFRTLAPILHLEACVGLADVVQESQHGQPSTINFGQSATRCAFQCTGHRMKTQQLVQDGCYIRHVIQKRMGADHSIRRAAQLAPWEVEMLIACW
ncbi:MAG: hypothetical protein ABT00_14285 [Bordetella sp. SCN 68-11]|nr:MAG: hypothetical protein ABT00_14285 [Bordetella sp. SCN 68-11]